MGKQIEEELKSQEPRSAFTRRDFVMTMLASGFALAVRPIAAQTAITTDTDGLTAGEVKIPVADGAIPAYRAMPAKGAKFPTVVVVQETSACTSTSRTYAGDSPSKATSQSLPSFMPARAMSRN